MSTFTQPSYRVAEMNAASLLELYAISADELKHVTAFGAIAIPQMQEWIAAWYRWLQTQPEFEHFFSDAETLERVKLLQQGYWKAFFEAEKDDSYVESRRVVGQTHARIGLPLHTYFSGMNTFMGLFVDLLKNQERPDQSLAMQSSVTKLLHLDTAIVVDAYSTIVEETVSAQSKTLMEMSTPVTQIWNDILLLPLVGIIDSHRARDILNATLAKISETQARIFILDISGVAVVDTAVANNLIKITKATSLMGCSCTISGVSPAIAQTIVELGIDVGTIKTTATMRDALADAFRRVGMEIREVS